MWNSLNHYFNNMTEENMTSFRTEGSPAFPVENTENDNSASSSEGKETNTDQTQSQDGEQKSGVGDKGDGTGADDFSKHPRWLERENDWKGRFNSLETRHVDEMNKLREEFEQRFASITPKKESNNGNLPEEVPEWFGGDQDAWNAFKAFQDQNFKKLRDEIINSQKEKSDNEQKLIKEATDYMNQQVTEIEQDKTINPQGDRVDRNKLLKFVLDNELVDTKGRWNYKAAFKMMKPAEVFQAKNALDEKKKIAGATTSDNRAETKPTDVKTSDDFKGPGMRPW